MNIILVSKVAEDQHSYLTSVKTYGLSATEIELFQTIVFFLLLLLMIEININKNLYFYNSKYTKMISNH